MKQNLIQTFTKKKEVKDIIDIFHKRNVEIRFVGGCIRDSLLNRKISDLDFAVKLKPEEIINLLNSSNIKFEDFGKRYGSFIVRINKEKFQLTSLREDFNQRGSDTNSRYTNSWKKDAERRDFTINALSLSPSGNLYDYFNGLEDLANGHVKFIGDIDKRIQEDHLRIFRYFRFLGNFKEYNVLQEYENVLLKHIPNLKQYISFEEMRKEFLKMIKNHFPIHSFQDFHIKEEKNLLVKQVNKWWHEENYVLGIEKCMNKINSFF